jgi:hypothetical protein
MDVRSAAGHRRDKSHLVAIAQDRLLSLEGANLLTVYEDVDVMLDLTILSTKLPFEAGEANLQALDQLRDVAPLSFHPGLTSHQPAKGSGDIDD